MQNLDAVYTSLKVRYARGKKIEGAPQMLQVTSLDDTKQPFVGNNLTIAAELGWKEAVCHLLLVLAVGQAVLPGHVQQGLNHCRLYFLT